MTFYICQTEDGDRRCDSCKRGECISNDDSYMLLRKISSWTHFHIGDGFVYKSKKYDVIDNNGKDLYVFCKDTGEYKWLDWDAMFCDVTAVNVPQKTHDFCLDEDVIIHVPRRDLYRLRGTICEIFPDTNNVRVKINDEPRIITIPATFLDKPEKTLKLTLNFSHNKGVIFFNCDEVEHPVFIKVTCFDEAIKRKALVTAETDLRKEVSSVSDSFKIPYNTLITLMTEICKEAGQRITTKKEERGEIELYYFVKKGFFVFNQMK